MEGEAVEFGTSGYTMDNIFVLYDRASDSVWYPTSEESLEAVSGKRKGQQIEILDEPAPMPLGDWLDANPDSTVLLPSKEEIERMREMRNRPYLGVQLGEREDGLYLDEVIPDTPAEEAGLKSGDKVLFLAGMEMASRRDLSEAIGEHAIGDEIEVIVERAGSEHKLTLTLGRRE